MEMSVKFLAGMSNSFPAMLQSDVVLVCSRREAFGRVTVEGMLAGKPVIGTRIGGTLELIREEFNGLLYTPGDYRELAHKIRYLHENPDEAYRMGKNGREWAQARFSQTRLAQEILSTLRKALVEWYQ
jgi:glycosyltransferase involved in cell wall biosynthesis